MTTTPTGNEKCKCGHTIKLHKLDILKTIISKFIHVKCSLCSCDDIVIVDDTVKNKK